MIQRHNASIEIALVLFIEEYHVTISFYHFVPALVVGCVALVVCYLPLKLSVIRALFGWVILILTPQTTMRTCSSYSSTNSDVAEVSHRSKLSTPTHACSVQQVADSGSQRQDLPFYHPLHFSLLATQLLLPSSSTKSTCLSKEWRDRLLRAFQAEDGECFLKILD